MAAPYHPGVEMLNGNVDTQLTVSGITGGLLLRMKLCGVAAVIASSPYWLYQTWAFILPGLHPQEKRWGLLAVIDGQPLKAEGELLEALRIQRAFRDTVGLALTLECLAWSSAAIGDGERAATLRGGTENAWHTIGATDILMHGRRTRDLLAARSRFGEGAYERRASADEGAARITSMPTTARDSVPVRLVELRWGLPLTASIMKAWRVQAPQPNLVWPTQRR